jgi:hypothetical protein
MTLPGGSDRMTDGVGGCRVAPKDAREPRNAPKGRTVLLPLPACGERVGVRRPTRQAQNCGGAPSPGLLGNPTSPRAAGGYSDIPESRPLGTVA